VVSVQGSSAAQAGIMTGRRWTRERARCTCSIFDAFADGADSREGAVLTSDGKRDGAEWMKAW